MGHFACRVVAQGKASGPGAAGQTPAYACRLCRHSGVFRAGGTAGKGGAITGFTR